MSFPCTRALRRERALRGGASPGFGIAAKHARQLVQYTPFVPCGRSHNPPHRSQYFSSTWISEPSILPMKSMIASLYEMKTIQPNKKPWHRFLGPGLVSLTMTCNAIYLGMMQLLQPGGDSRLRLSEVPLLVAGLEHLPVLHNDAQTPIEVNGLQQPLHSRREHFRRAYLPAELPEASLFVFMELYFYHGCQPSLRYKCIMRHIIKLSYSSEATKSITLFPYGCYTYVNNSP